MLFIRYMLYYLIMFPVRWQYSLQEPDARVKILCQGPEALFEGSLVEIEMAISGFKRQMHKEEEAQGGSRIIGAAQLTQPQGNTTRHSGLVTE